ncbi:hypothetical protein HMPREF0372_01435 [Flavonifractor plautii ATCC 29863]|uniref:Uncharacterized protein n=1 Tax=Flavonifractor plautii ATCC 29863 TaxID=411475 RepID=G9YPJ9_FLAPL|nr:hypothetical protein HMPREF0372_01435 [Flavonifractor plautii ATCC 29863]
MFIFYTRAVSHRPPLCILLVDNFKCTEYNCQQLQRRIPL